jgi:hypothetical protein
VVTKGIILSCSADKTQPFKSLCTYFQQYGFFDPETGGIKPVFIFKKLTHGNKIIKLTVDHEEEKTDHQPSTGEYHPSSFRKYYYE